MTRKRAKELASIIAAYGEGKAIQYLWAGRWVDPSVDNLFDLVDGVEYRIKPEPKKRLMTRDEVLGFVSYHGQGMLVRTSNDIPFLPYACHFLGSIYTYEYAHFDERGKQLTEWRKFEIEEGGEG